MTAVVLFFFIAVALAPWLARIRVVREALLSAEIQAAEFEAKYVPGAYLDSVTFCCAAMAAFL